MPRTCTVCNSPKRPEIDVALLSGGSYRSIARRYNAPPDSVFRHKRDHLPAQSVKAKNAAEVLTTDRLKALRSETLAARGETADFQAAVEIL